MKFLDFLQAKFGLLGGQEWVQNGPKLHILQITIDPSIHYIFFKFDNSLKHINALTFK